MNILPSVLEISPTGGLDLDELRTLKAFLGKDRRAALEMFKGNAAHWVDCLHAMGPSAFRYYFPAYLDYLQSPNALTEPGALHALLTVLDVRCLYLNDMEESFKGIERDTLGFLDYIENHRELFDLDERIYGDVIGRLSRWREFFRDKCRGDQCN